MLVERIGNYRIVRQLGEGGMGVVYEGVRDDIGSRAAIKVLQPEFALNAEAAARFFNEARAANLIEHPGIVRIFDYGQLPNGAPYLAMELLSGESLHQRLQRERRLSEPDALRLGRQIATALSAAHAKEVIHRDLKPENIFIVPDAEAPGGERAKILDFGIAKLAHGQTGMVRTHTNAVMGTPIYMSPEQCKGGKHVGDRSDVYALGVILFEMLTGRPPFVAEQAGEYIGMHLFKEPPPLRSLAPAVSPGLHQIVDRLLLKDPQARPTMLMAANTLKALGNLTSDVISLRALSGESQPAESPAPKGAAARNRIPVNLKPMAGPDLAALEANLPPDNSDVETLVLGGAGRRANYPPPASAVAPAAALAARAVAAKDNGSLRREPVAPPVASKPDARTWNSDWQPVEVQQPSASLLDNLDPDVSSLNLDRPRGRSFGQNLRSLRFRMKQQLSRWVGLTSVTGKRKTPSGTMLVRRRNAVLILALGIAIAVVLAVLYAWGPMSAAGEVAPSRTP